MEIERSNTFCSEQIYSSRFLHWLITSPSQRWKICTDDFSPASTANNHGSKGFEPRVVRWRKRWSNTDDCIFLEYGNTTEETPKTSPKFTARCAFYNRYKGAKTRTSKPEKTEKAKTGSFIETGTGGRGEEMQRKAVVWEGCWLVCLDCVPLP